MKETKKKIKETTNKMSNAKLECLKESLRFTGTTREKVLNSCYKRNNIPTVKTKKKKGNYRMPLLKD